jgi:hypothetical protein
MIDEIEHGIAGGVYDNMGRLAKGGTPSPVIHVIAYDGRDL